MAHKMKCMTSHFWYSSNDSFYTLVDVNIQFVFIVLEIKTIYLIRLQWRLVQIQRLSTCRRHCRQLANFTQGLLRILLVRVGIVTNPARSGTAHSAQTPIAETPLDTFETAQVCPPTKTSTAVYRPIISGNLNKQPNYPNC